jgi:hypothetical protein
MKDPEEFPVVYANLVRISHVAMEFYLDFKRQSPEHPDAEEAPTLMRILLNPFVAKSFRDALSENLRRYEQHFGEVPTAQSPPAEKTH